MAPHSSTLAWKIPWTEEPGRLQFMGPNPPLLQVVEWTERGPIISTNDSIHMPSP